MKRRRRCWSGVRCSRECFDLQNACAVKGFADSDDYAVLDLLDALVSPFAASAFPEINTAIAHLRDVLGDDKYGSLSRKGESMTTSAMATYAYDQIDWARAELEQLR
jgi:hypothetical protein